MPVMLLPLIMCGLFIQKLVIIWLLMFQMFLYSQLYTSNEGVTLGNDNTLRIHCVGFGLLSDSYSKLFLAIKHVLHTPHATSNMLYVLIIKFLLNFIVTFFC